MSTKMTKSKESKNLKSYEFYVSELRTYLNWALSTLNKYKDELIDVGFVIYLELYIKLFKQSSNLGRDFLVEFMNVFNSKYEKYISKLLQFKFLDQLDQLNILNTGYNASNKYIVILSKNCKRILLNWLNIYHNNVINIILMERVEFIDGEMFNHTSVNVFKRYFILKYGIDPESIHKCLRPFLGLYIKDVENSNYKMNSLLIEPLKENKILFGLPCELYTKDYGHEVNTYSQGINGEFSMMEDFRKLIPLPRPGSLLHESLRSLYQLQAENRNMGQNPYILSYNFANVNSINCSAVSDFDGRYAAVGQRDGSILLWDLVKSQCENAYSDIACIVGKDIAIQSVNKSYPAYFNSTKESGSYDKNDNKREHLILNGHDGLINCLKFGENGQVLLSGGLDSTINLYSISDSFDNNSIKCVYYNSCYPSGSYTGGPGVSVNATNCGTPATEESGLRRSSSISMEGSVSSSPSRVSTPTGRGRRGATTPGTPNSQMSVNHDTPQSGRHGTPNYNDGVEEPSSNRSISPRAAGPANRGGATSGNSVIDLDYSRFGYYFSSCDLNGYCKLWSTDRSFPIRTLKFTSTNFSSSRFHPNSSLMSVVSNDNKINLYDLKSFNSVLHFSLPGASGGFTAGSAGNFSHSGASGRGYGHGSTRTMYGSLTNTINGMNWSKNGVILGVYTRNRVFLYDVRMGKPFERIEIHSGKINSIDFSYSTTLLSVTDTSNELSLWGFNDFNKYMLATDPNNEKRNQANKKLIDEQLKEGQKKLIKSYRFNKTYLLSSTFTPENVLIALGISAI